MNTAKAEILCSTEIAIDASDFPLNVILLNHNDLYCLMVGSE